MGHFNCNDRVKQDFLINISLRYMLDMGLFKVVILRFTFLLEAIIKESSLLNKDTTVTRQ